MPVQDLSHAGLVDGHTWKLGQAARYLPRVAKTKGGWKPGESGPCTSNYLHAQPDRHRCADSKLQAQRLRGKRPTILPTEGLQYISPSPKAALLAGRCRGDMQVPFDRTVPGDCVAHSPRTRRSDWIVAQTRSKPYGLLRNTVERRRCMPVRVVRTCGLGRSVGLRWATKCCAD